MRFLRNFMKPIAQAVAVMFFLMTSLLPVAQASMVSTESLIQEQQTQWNKSELSALVEREDVKLQLQNMGVDINDVQARIDALTDEEIQQMSANLNEMPAGGGVVSIALTVFIVLVITDLLGATNIFPFIKSIR